MSFFIAGLMVLCGAVAAQTPAKQAPAAPAGPTITLAPGLREVPDNRKSSVDPPAPVIP
jgi:hypothetical protein